MCCKILRVQKWKQPKCPRIRGEVKIKAYLYNTKGMHDYMI